MYDPIEQFLFNIIQLLYSGVFTNTRIKYNLIQDLVKTLFETHGTATHPEIALIKKMLLEIQNDDQEIYISNLEVWFWNLFTAPLQYYKEIKMHLLVIEYIKLNPGIIKIHGDALYSTLLNNVRDEDLIHVRQAIAVLSLT